MLDLTRKKENGLKCIISSHPLSIQELKWSLPNIVERIIEWIGRSDVLFHMVIYSVLLDSPQDHRYKYIQIELIDKRKPIHCFFFKKIPFIRSKCFDSLKFEIQVELMRKNILVRLRDVRFMEAFLYQILFYINQYVKQGQLSVLQSCSLYMSVLFMSFFFVPMFMSFLGSPQGEFTVLDFWSKCHHYKLKIKILRYAPVYVFKSRRL